MKTNNVIRVGVWISLSVLFFWLGSLWGSRGIVTYLEQGKKVAFHKDSPSDGLPIAMYAMLLSEMRGGHSDRALDHLESLLDMALLGGERRRPLLRDWRLAEFDKSLIKAARYRDQFPRPLSQGTGFYLTADKQTEIDRFLRAVSTREHQP
jgi:hypothetical protein